MSTVWFTSDTHFKHRKVADLRGFDSKDEHDAAIVANWNSVVRSRDIVWHLGDVAMDSGGLDYVSDLNGTIHLVTGNHDAAWPAHREAHKHQRVWLEMFASVQAFAKVRVAGELMLLSHFPYNGDHSPHDRHTQFRLRDEGEYLLHGHIHQETRKTSDHSLHVGLDAWGLKPVSIDEVAAWMHR